MALFKDVEPDVIFRHLVWSVLFVSAVAYYINVYILPHIESYKEQVRFTRVTREVLENTKAINTNAQSRVNAFSNSNYEKLKVFGGNINESVIRKNLPKGFLRLNVKKLREEVIPKDQLKKQFYSISGEVGINNLTLILDIVPTLHKKNMSAILELPLSLKKTPKGNLAFSIQIAITQSTYTR